MKINFIDPSFEILASSYDPENELPFSYDDNPYKLIEYAGRVCYKSEDKITENSCYDFFNRLVKKGHLSVLEHSWLSIKEYGLLRNSFASRRHVYDLYPVWPGQIRLIFGNIRALGELIGDMFWLEYTKTAKLRNGDRRKNNQAITVKIICDRGVSHELVRHRLASFSQESTRYCNYKGEMTFIKPLWVDWSKLNDDEEDWSDIECWYDSVTACCYNYRILLGKGMSPQHARTVLPNSLKTEIVVTANQKEWEHIFKLRCSKKAHPEMSRIMVPLFREMQKYVYMPFDQTIDEMIEMEA